MSKVKFYGLGEIDDAMLSFAVIVSRYNGKWVYSKNKKRAWEIPGGKREKNENVLETAKRELYEETGALEYDLEPVCICVFTNTDYHGLLCYADIKKLGELPDNSDIEKIDFFDNEPENVSFPDFYPEIFGKVRQFILSGVAFQ
jgi:8-oxo-dGTP diphosphatase